MRRESLYVHGESERSDPFGALVAPIYQSTCFDDVEGTFDYSRSRNPTRAGAESQIARVEGGDHGFLFASGMAALTALLRCIPQRGRIVAGSDLYGGTFRLLGRLAERDGLNVEFTDGLDVSAFERVLSERADLVLVETPTNPLCRVVDLEALGASCRGVGAVLAVDNSLMSPHLQRPLTLGADVVLHSATKHLSGHGDVVAGAIVTNDERLARELAFVQNAEGAGLGPHDAWLLVRGMKTLGVRVDHQQRTAERVACWLEERGEVSAVHFVGSPEHPDFQLHRRQAQGPGTVLSFETGDVGRSQRIVQSTEMFRRAVSFGSVTSLISMPCEMSHASVPKRLRSVQKLPHDLIRLSFGLEHQDDLIEDLEQAFAAAER